MLGSCTDVGMDMTYKRLLFNFKFTYYVVVNQPQADVQLSQKYFSMLLMFSLLPSIHLAWIASLANTSILDLTTYKS